MRYRAPGSFAEPSDHVGLDKGASICYTTLEMQRLEALPSSQTPKPFLRRGDMGVLRAAHAAHTAVRHDARLSLCIPMSGATDMARRPQFSAALTDNPEPMAGIPIVPEMNPALAPEIAA